MVDDQEGRLAMPGVSLFYRARGAGPLLVILPGGDADADTTSALTARLVERFRVVTFDRRGLSRSAVDSGDPGAAAAVPITITTHAEDVHHLLSSVAGGEPALVFGTSIGALIALDLLVRHPEQVRTLVAHEAPTLGLLPDGEREQAVRAHEAIEEAMRREGPAAAMDRLGVYAAVDYADREPEVPPSGGISPRRATNLAFMFAHDMPAIRSHRLDLPALRTLSTRIIPAAGSPAPQSVPYRCAFELARSLGVPLAELPGGHTGWLLRPAGFAAALAELLS